MLPGDEGGVSSFSGLLPRELLVVSLSDPSVLLNGDPIAAPAKHLELTGNGEDWSHAVNGLLQEIC